MTSATLPNLVSAGIIAIVSALYVWVNWDCFEHKYRVGFIVSGVCEIIVLAYAPLVLIGVAMLTAASKSDIERGDESYIKDFPTVFHLVPGSYFWHYYNSLTALLFVVFMNLVFLYFSR